MNCLEQQRPLFSAEDDEAMLLPVEQLTKRYTGRQVAKLEWKRNAILMLLGAGYPVDTISVQLHANKRTVTELAKRSAEKVARFNKEFADILLSTGSRWIGLARTKEDGASFRDLTIGAGIVMQHARDLVAMGDMGEKEIVKEREDHLAAIARLREWFDQGVRESNAADRLIETATPQPVVSCGVKAREPLKITSEQSDKTKDNPMPLNALSLVVAIKEKTGCATLIRDTAQVELGAPDGDQAAEPPQAEDTGQGVGGGVGRPTRWK